jgi:hypothetical protein
MKMPWLKALLGAVAAGLAAAAGAIVGGHMSASAWIAVVLAAIGGFNAVYWARNTPATPPAGPVPPVAEPGA